MLMGEMSEGSARMGSSVLKKSSFQTVSKDDAGLVEHGRKCQRQSCFAHCFCGLVQMMFTRAMPLAMRPFACTVTGKALAD
jgi:hypothetical protein